MKLNFMVPAVLICLFLFPKSMIAQDRESIWSIEKKEPLIEKNKVNQVIDSVVEDFFLKEQSLSSNSESNDERNSNTANSSVIGSMSSNNDRKLEMALSARGSGAKLKVLDKIYGTSQEFKLDLNSNVLINSVNVLLKECLYQKGNPKGSALALVRILDFQQNQLPFSGWISSTQSHLTNYDNYRYSFWLESCTIFDQE